MVTKSAKANRPKTNKTKSPARDMAAMTPDSVSKRDDALPDDLRSRDVGMTPDSLPELEQEEAKLSPDGGASDHPTHDEPMEDMAPEDYERQIDDAERAKLEKHTEDETIDPRATRDFAPGSADPLDQKDRRPFRVKQG